MSAILRSIPILKDAIYINICFLVTFAICGLQIFKGLHRKICFDA